MVLRVILYVKIFSYGLFRISLWSFIFYLIQNPIELSQNLRSFHFENPWLIEKYKLKNMFKILLKYRNEILSVLYYSFIEILSIVKTFYYILRFSIFLLLNFVVVLLIIFLYPYLLCIFEYFVNVQA